MPAVNEQWTRGAGRGIGMSDHQNSFQCVLPQAVFATKDWLSTIRSTQITQFDVAVLVSGLECVSATGSKPEQQTASFHCRPDLMPQRPCALTTAQE